jgi:hypothetical protein
MAARARVSDNRIQSDATLSPSMFRFAGMLCLAALLALSPAHAQNKKPPAGMTPEQYQSMVDDIADAVAKKM